MNLKLSVAAAGLAAALLMPAAASSQTIYLKTQDIPGTSKAAKRTEWIELQSLAEGLAAPSTAATGAGRSSGRPAFQDISFERQLDAASLKFREFAITGKRLPQVEVEFVPPGPGGVAAYKITLKDVLITSVATSMSAGGGGASETVTMNFGEVTWSMPSQTGPGSPAPFGWNISRNAKP